MSRPSGPARWDAELRAARTVADEVLLRLTRIDPGARLARAKGRLDEVTEADLDVERFTRRRLGVLTPGLTVVGEEAGGSTDAGTYWLVDPIDGTVNFARQHPLFAFSLALVVERTPVVGALALPALGVVHAASGRGPGGQPARLAVDAMVVATGGLTPRHGGLEDERRLQVLRSLHAGAYRLRISGSLAVDLLSAALGWVDAAVAYAPQTWDVAAGVALARSQGLHVVNGDGVDFSLGDDLAVAARHRGSAEDLVALVTAARARPATATT